MIFENSVVKGLKSDLARLDEVTSRLGFVRWQWEYYRATYDLKFEDKQNGKDYYLRINARVVEGKLEDPDAVLVIGDAYMGTATFPHGIDYEAPIPESYIQSAKRILDELSKSLSQ